MASIEDLKGIISQKGGAARSNIFSVTLPSLPGATTRDINLLCRDATLPGKQIITYDKEIGTKREKVAYGYVHEDVSMSFLLLNDYGIRKYFETWQKIAFNQSEFQIGYKSDYVRDITISQLKKGKSLPVYSTSLGIPQLPTLIQNRLPRIGPFDLAQGEINLDFLTPDSVVYKCKLYDAWPVAMETITLNNELDGLIELRVQFTFTNWSSEITENDPITDFVETAVGSVLTRVFND